VLPIVERLLANNAVDRNQRGRTPRVIVLAPTRELAKQVWLCKSFSPYLTGAATHDLKVSDMCPEECLSVQAHKGSSFLRNCCKRHLLRVSCHVQRRKRSLNSQCTAVQVHADFEYIGKAASLATVCLYGGSPYGPQESVLRRGCDVVVGTPGRVKDHLERGTLKLQGLM
jgi:hypothetical protein